MSGSNCSKIKNMISFYRKVKNLMYFNEINPKINMNVFLKGTHLNFLIFKVEQNNDTRENLEGYNCRAYLLAFLSRSQLMSCLFLECRLLP